MSRQLQRILSAVVVLVGFATQGALANSYNTLPEIEKSIGFDQKPGSDVPLSLAFRDETGNRISLVDAFRPGPVILALVYYGCPNLCTLTLDGLFKALQELPFNAGEKFSVAVVSIDPSEGPALAAEKRKKYLIQYHRTQGAKGIHFLTGSQDSIQALAKSIGFRYAYDERSKQFAHPAGVTVLTPEGKISRYLFGVEYAGKDLRFALLDASKGTVGTKIDKFLMYCYHYDPFQGSYGFAVMRALRFSAAATVVGLLGLIGFYLRKERRVNRRRMARPDREGQR